MTRIEKIVKMLAEQPKDSFLRFAYAKELENNHQIEEALKSWEWFVENDPNYTGFYYHYAQLLAKDNRHERAINLISNGLDICKKNNDMHSFRELSALRDTFPDQHLD